MPQWLALLLSVGIEAVTAFVLLTALGWGNGRRGALAAALGTFATHWIAWWSIISLLDRFGYWTAFAMVESGVVLAEAVPYRVLVPLRLRRALLCSLVANAASAGFGLVLYAMRVI